MNKRAKELATLGVMTALTMVFSLLESLLPPLIPTIPYIKIGFSNIGILFILIVCGIPHAFVASVIKCLFAAIFSGAVSSVLYSVPSSLAAVAVMAILLHSRGTGVIFLSIMGAIVHITMQMFVAVFVTGTFSVLIYVPYLGATSCITGGLVGFVVRMIICRYPFKFDN